MDACAALAESIARLAELGHSNRRFLKELGRAAGVRRGPLWLTDAATGGSNRLRGRGFRAVVDDETDGRARHVAGTVAVAPRRRNDALAHHPRAAGCARQRRRATQTTRAIEFVRLVRSGELAQADAAGWVRRRLVPRSRTRVDAARPLAVSAPSGNWLNA